MNFIQLIHKKTYERIVHVIRRHTITFIPIALLFIALILVPPIVDWMGQNLWPDFFTSASLYPLLVLFLSVYYLSLCLFFYSYFIDFYLDILIITNDRLVDIDQKGLFARSVAEIELYQIQDITSQVEGFFPSIFNYGQLIIQTASAVPRVIVHNVPNPHLLRQELLDLAAIDKKYHQNN